ncbi:TBKB1 protein, partial [Thryothorus ludovicianus]|nr:TBKB1 protein [Thryothorus ludovicianus]
MDSMFEDDISILTQEALGPDEDWLDSPNTDLSGEMCSASHFALITAYDDIKNRPVVSPSLGVQDWGPRSVLATLGFFFGILGLSIFPLLPCQGTIPAPPGIPRSVTASTPLQKTTPKSVWGEGEGQDEPLGGGSAGPGLSPVPPSFPEQRALVETHLSRIRSLEQQLRQRDSGAFPGLGTPDVPFIALHPNPGLSHVLERAGGWQSRGLEAELEAARQESQRAQHREEQLKAECERLQAELKHLQDSREQEQSERDMAWVKKVGDDQ